MFYNVKLTGYPPEREGIVMDEKAIRTQAKIFILYILGNVEEAVEFTVLNDMIQQDGLVTYFDFAAAFSELVLHEQIAAVGEGEDGEVLYTVTEEGRAVLDMYGHELPTDVRDRVLRHAQRVLVSKRRGVKYHSTVIPTGTGWTVTCTISDRSKTLFSTSVYAATHEYAEKLRESFEDRSDIIYRGVMTLFSGDVNFIFE